MNNGWRTGKGKFWLLALLGPALLVAGCSGGDTSSRVGDGDGDGDGTLPPPITERISVASDGTQGNEPSLLSAVSADGRFVVFDSFSDNLLVTPDGNGVSDIFLRDTCFGAPAGCNPSTTLVSRSSADVQGNNDSVQPAISDDGRFVAFASLSDNLVANDNNGSFDIFLRDTCFGAPAGCVPATTLVSRSSADVQGNKQSLRPSISADGRFIAFDSDSDNLVTPDGNGVSDIFLRDTCFGAPAGCVPATTRLSVSSDGDEGNQESIQAAISDNARFVAFASRAFTLVANDTNGSFDVFLRDTCFGAGCVPSTILVSRSSADVQGNKDSLRPSISADGRFVAFDSDSDNLVTPDGNGTFDVFLHDTCLGAGAGCVPSTTRLSVSSSGGEGNKQSLRPSISDDGRFIAFDSDSDNLAAPDGNGVSDIFLRDTCFAGPAGCVPATTLVSRSSGGQEGIESSIEAAISDDAAFVSFQSTADNLVANDNNGVADIFITPTGF